MSQPNVILLVEDDPNDAFFFSRALAGLGFTGKLRHVTDVDAAKKILNQSQERPELVVADSAVSPRGSGVELHEWQRAQGLDLPFFILTGGMDPELRERAEAAGVRKVFTKESSLTAILEQVREMLLTLPPERRAWLK